jgi:hypothetical protein
MKKHNGMRPQDIVILLKIAAMGNKNWYMKDLAYSLGISQSEISESLNRSVICGLISCDKKKLMKKSLLEFLEFGMKYVYPQQPGPVVRGIPTAHSVPPLSLHISSSEIYVWPDADGDHRGQAIEPLHPGVPGACKKDDRLYELLSLSDAVRVGRSREYKIAVNELNRIILDE